MVEQAVPVTSVQTSGTVAAAVAAAAAPVEPVSSSLETGPRTAGARRSSERDRGSSRKRNKRATTKKQNKSVGDDTSWQ